MEHTKTKKSGSLSYVLFIIIVGSFFYFSGSKSNSSYVEPYVTKSGKFVKGHVRKKTSISKNAVAKQHYSKAYYSRNKYRIKKIERKKIKKIKIENWF
jgi:hypothetical protein